MKLLWLFASVTDCLCVSVCVRGTWYGRVGGTCASESVIGRWSGAPFQFHPSSVVLCGSGCGSDAVAMLGWSVVTPARSRPLFWVSTPHCQLKTIAFDETVQQLRALRAQCGHVRSS